MAYVAIAGMAVSLGTTAYGAISEGSQRKKMKKEREKWNAELNTDINGQKLENEALFNNDYYGDYTQRADVQNTIRQMREEQKHQNDIDNNASVVTGATPEAQVAAKEARNKAMGGVFSNIAAQGAQFKDRAKQHYISNKSAIENRKMGYKTGYQQMEYADMEGTAQSANNLMQNGIKGMAGTDWAGIMGSNSGGSGAVGKQVQSDYTPPPKIGLDPNAGRNFG